MSTLILKVDLSCCLCTNKIRRILYKYKERWDIHEITWDEKNNHIILVGPFNQEELAKKLCCKACKVIKEIIIPDPPPPPPEPEPTPDPPPPPPEPEPPQPQPEPTPEPPKPPPPSEPTPEPPKPPPPPEPIPPYTPMFWVTGQICACGPCHKGYQPCPCNCGTGRRPQCGCGCGGGGGGGGGDYGYGYGYGYGHSCGPGVPPPPPASGGSTCHVYYEEDHNACTIM